MKTEKLSLKGIKSVLSRRELKRIMAGGSGGGGGCQQQQDFFCGEGAPPCCPGYSCIDVGGGTFECYLN
jgi:hypothetical protein